MSSNATLSTEALEAMALPFGAVASGEAPTAPPPAPRFFRRIAIARHAPEAASSARAAAPALRLAPRS